MNNTIFPLVGCFVPFYSSFLHRYAMANAKEGKFGVLDSLPDSEGIYKCEIKIQSRDEMVLAIQDQLK